MRKAFFRIDCSNEVGMGHLSRALTLSTFLKEFEIDLFIFGKVNIQEQWKSSFKRIYILETPLKLNLNDKYDLGIFDFSTKNTLNVLDALPIFFESLKKEVNKILVIDGLGEECLFLKNLALKADFLLIPYAGAPHLEGRFQKYFKGPSYFVFSHEILKTPVSPSCESVENILITMGGADPFEMSLKIIRSLKRLSNKCFKFRLIIGPSFSEELKMGISELTDEDDRFYVKDGSAGIREDILSSDLCITASGLTKYEMAKLRKPMIVICHDINSHKTNESFKKLGLCEDLGVFTSLKEEQIADSINNLILDKTKRLSMSEKASTIFNSNVFEEFINKIKE